MQRLYDYLHNTMFEGETAYGRYARFGMELGVSMFAVRKWAYGQRRVPDDMKMLIEKATQRRVKVRDMVKHDMGLRKNGKLMKG